MKILDVFLAILITLSVIAVITVVNKQLTLSYESYTCFYFDEAKNVGVYVDEMGCENTDRWVCDSGNTYYSCLAK